MAGRKAANGLDFEALRGAIERCDLKRVLVFYLDGAEPSIVYASALHCAPFDLRGKSENTKYLRAVFGQSAAHCVEREVLGEDRVTFREAFEYPDGNRVMVQTTLELRDGRIVRQVTVVVSDAQADREISVKDHPQENGSASHEVA